jgi:hypothetical protein
MAKQKQTKKAREEKESSLIVSRVQQQRKPGEGNTIIRSRVIHGDAAVEGVAAPKAARKSAKRAPKRTPRPSANRSTRKTARTTTPPTSTES